MSDTTIEKPKGKPKLANKVEPSVPITMIATEDLIDPLYYLERDNEEDVIAELARSIEHNGLLNPLTVKKVGKQYRILAGAHRFKAIQEIHWEEIPCRIIKATKAGEIMMTLAENINRFDVQPIIIAHLISELQAREKLSQVAIAERFGKSESWVSRKLSILNTLPETQDKLATGTITEQTAVELSRMPDPVSEKAALDQAMARGMTSMRVREMVDDYEVSGTLEPAIAEHETLEIEAAEDYTPSIGECAFDKHEHLLSDLKIVWICPEHFELLKKVLMQDGIEFFHI